MWINFFSQLPNYYFIQNYVASDETNLQKLVGSRNQDLQINVNKICVMCIRDPQKVIRVRASIILSSGMIVES